MEYEKVGAINNISDIQFNKDIVVNGSVDKTGWMWHMEGKFEKRGDKIVFVDNVIELAREVKEGEVDLTVLKEI